MQETPKYKTYEFSGALAARLQDFVAEKRGVGYVYNTEAKHLGRFSRFSLDYEVPQDELPENLVMAWIAKKPTDSDRNQYSRYSLISQFARYMVRMGCRAYVPSRSDIGRTHRTFIPYIFTHDEIKALFAVLDSLETPLRSGAPRRKDIIPVLFRLLYCCGLRVSEATKLKGEDVDLENGVLTIRNSKFGKSRYVPMSPETTARCAEYDRTRLVGRTGDDWFFAAPYGGHYDARSIYSMFRQYLWDAGISHGGKGKGPRVHDLRHTFAVHCLQKWVASGEDITTALPRLSAYMGHNDFSATERYLRLTAEVYPEISSLMNEKYGYIIPRMAGGPYEED